jgi:hypothetical protein
VQASGRTQPFSRNALAIFSPSMRPLSHTAVTRPATILAQRSFSLQHPSDGAANSVRDSLGDR